MQPDLAAMKGLAESLYTARIAAQYGGPGLIALRRLLESVNETHRQSAYETWNDGLTIFAPLNPDDEILDPAGSVDLTSAELAQRLEQGATIMPIDRQRMRVWFQTYDPIELGQSAVVYHFQGNDHFVIDGALEVVPNGSGLPSAFGLPTFLELEDALMFYGIRLARQSSCYVLQGCWHDGRRTFLKNKPEATMRKSLAQYLRGSLRAHELVEVREEQNVDESHPVDVKVTWSLTNRLALIEIKWLGDSVNVEGTAPSTSYRDARACEGAKQLVDYLDENKVRAPQHITRGYLVVFDARRRGANAIDVVLSAEDARYFVNQEIAFEPVWEETRPDFHKPLRFYLEPAA
jgi:hypothetical protein